MRSATWSASCGSSSATSSSGTTPSSRWARSSTEPERATAAAGAAQDEVGQPDDLRGRAVVADELDDPGLRVAGAEAEEVRRGGAGEGVDRLRGVADDADVLALSEPQLEEGLLEAVDVLVLVDDEVPVLRPHGAGDLLVLAEDAGGQEQDVLEVDDAALGLHRLVLLDDAGHRRGVEAGRRLAPGTRGGRGVGVGGEHRDLGPLDLGGDVAHPGRVEPEAQAATGLGDGARLVRHHLGGGAADGLRPEVVQLPQRRGVEGACLDPADPEVAQPGAHLAGGAGGEGDGEDALRLVGP